MLGILKWENRTRCQNRGRVGFGIEGSGGQMLTKVQVLDQSLGGEFRDRVRCQPWDNHAGQP